MNTSELLHIAENLQRQALDAYAYRQIIQQYRANLTEYSAEMKYSSAFYSIIYQSLHESMLMCLAKIYDWDDQSLTIRTIETNISIITFEQMDKKMQEIYAIKNSFPHDLRPEEERYFLHDVETTKRWCDF